MAALPVDFDMRRPFTRKDAIAAGVSASALRGRNFRGLCRGVYIHASVPHHPLLDVIAALLVHPPSAFASHTSAATVYGVIVPSTPVQHVSVFDAADRRAHGHIRKHVVPAATPVTTVMGLRVSSPTRCFVELAELLGLVDLVVTGDHLVRLKRAAPPELRDACAQAAGPHAPLARRAASLVREDVDSPMESRLRMLLVLAGLPEPVVNHKVYDDTGRLLYRFDLSYPELKIVVEYDGRQHREDLDQWDHDIDRHDWFRQNGWHPVTVVSRGIYKQPERTVARVHAVLKERGCTTLPRRLSDEWRAYFPATGRSR